MAEQDYHIKYIKYKTKYLNQLARSQPNLQKQVGGYDYDELRKEYNILARHQKVLHDAYGSPPPTNVLSVLDQVNHLLVKLKNDIDKLKDQMQSLTSKYKPNIERLKKEQDNLINKAAQRPIVDKFTNPLPY
jgi:hypothetical protein